MTRCKKGGTGRGLEATRLVATISIYYSHIIMPVYHNLEIKKIPGGPGALSTNCLRNRAEALDVATECLPVILRGLPELHTLSIIPARKTGYRAASTVHHDASGQDAGSFV